MSIELQIEESTKYIFNVTDAYLNTQSMSKIKGFGSCFNIKKNPMSTNLSWRGEHWSLYISKSRKYKNIEYISNVKDICLNIQSISEIKGFSFFLKINSMSIELSWRVEHWIFLCANLGQIPVKQRPKFYYISNVYLTTPRG